MPAINCDRVLHKERTKHGIALTHCDGLMEPVESAGGAVVATRCNTCGDVRPVRKPAKVYEPGEMP